MKFDPNRFLAKAHEPYTFLPFNDGPRNCIGQHLALLESKMVLALLAQRYSFSVASGVGTEFGGETDPRHRYTVPVIPRQEIQVIVGRRDTKQQ